VLIFALIAFMLQTPAPPAPTEPASVEGRVVKYGTGEPLVGVTVELQRGQAPAPAGPPLPVGQPISAGPVPPVKVGIEGKFKAPNVPPGEYRLHAPTSSRGPSPTGSALHIK
jgi:hypothetical protein